MTVAELLALPVGQRLAWEEWRLEGEVVASGGGHLRIRWAGGEEAVIDPEDGDTDLGEFAAILERADPDEPVVVNLG